jgi:hypothetical protein
MFLVGMLNWWYTDGWKARRQTSGRQLIGVAGFFSIGQLASTLFSPFRQISAGQVNGPAGVQLRAFFDQLLSRVVGLVIRTLFIVAGLLIMALLALIEFLIIVLWLIVPLLPVVGCIMAVIGWMPWK